VNATIDSDMRFYAVLFAAFGLGFVWAARDLGRRTSVANLLGLLFFLGGLTRLLAWAQTGPPNWFLRRDDSGRAGDPRRELEAAHWGSTLDAS